MVVDGRRQAGLAEKIWAVDFDGLMCCLAGMRGILGFFYLKYVPEIFWQTFIESILYFSIIYLFFRAYLAMYLETGTKRECES